MYIFVSGKEKCLENICKQFGGESNVFMFGVDKEDEKIAEKVTPLVT